MSATGYLGFLGNGWGYALGAAVAERERCRQLHMNSDSNNSSAVARDVEEEDIYTTQGRWVINTHGDGSAGFHIAELDTYARHHLKILTVVINNAVWGMSLAGQDLVYGSTTPARLLSKLSPQTRYDVVAAGFGVSSVRVEKFEDIAEVLSRITMGGTEVSKDVTDGPGKDRNGSRPQDPDGANEKQRPKPALMDLIVSDRPITQVTKAMVGMPASPSDGPKKNGKRSDVIAVPYYDNLPRVYYTEDLEGCQDQ